MIFQYNKHNKQKTLLRVEYDCIVIEYYASITSVLDFLVLMVRICLPA